MLVSVGFAINISTEIGTFSAEAPPGGSVLNVPPGSKTTLQRSRIPPLGRRVLVELELVVVLRRKLRLVGNEFELFGVPGIAQSLPSRPHPLFPNHKVFRPPSVSLRRPLIWARKIRFSAARYSFLSNSTSSDEVEAGRGDTRTEPDRPRSAPPPERTPSRSY